MSPNLGKTTFTETELAELRREVAEIIDRERLTRKKVAEEAGVPEGTFGPWLSDTYRKAGGSAEREQEVAAAIWRWQRAREDRAAAALVSRTQITFQRTANAAQVLTALEHAQFLGDLVVVGLPPGLGKTAAALQHKATRPRVFLATMRQSTRGVPTSLVQVLAAMGEPGAKGTPHSLSNRILEKLREPGSLVIIDETQVLTQAAVDELRSLHDASGAGFAFLGDKSVFRLFDGGSSLAQFSSRIGYRVSRPAPVSADAETLVGSIGVTDKGRVQILRQIASKPGGLRGMTKCLAVAERLAGGLDVMTPGHLREAFGQLAPEMAL